MKNPVLMSSIAGLVIVVGIGAIIFHHRSNVLNGDYIAIGNNEVDLLAVTEGSGGSLTGTLYTATLNGDQLSKNESSFQGQFTHGYVSLNFGGAFGQIFGATATGHKSGGTISLTSSGTDNVAFHSSSLNTYQAQVGILQKQAAKALAKQQAQQRAQAAAQAAAAQQAQVQQNNQNAVDNAAGAVVSDIGNLSDDVANMGDDLASMSDDLASQQDDVASAQDDLTGAQQDYQSGLGMTGDVSTMQSDVQAQENDYRLLKNQDVGQTLAKDEQTVNADIAQIKADYATYEQVSQQYGMTGSSNIPDPQTAIQQAQNTLAQYHATENSYLQKSQQYIKTVEGYLSQVQSMANSGILP